MQRQQRQRRSVLLTGPAIEPLTFNEVKGHARVYSDSDQPLVEELISSARALFERDTGRILINQTWRVWFDAPYSDSNSEWWDGVRDGAIDTCHIRSLELTPGPVLSISQVKTISDQGTESLFSSDNYFLDNAQYPSQIVLNKGVKWPTPIRKVNGLYIDIVVGYGPLSTDIPKDILYALKLAVTHAYHNRGDVLSGEANTALTNHLRPTINKFKYAKI